MKYVFLFLLLPVFCVNSFACEVISASGKPLGNPGLEEIRKDRDLPASNIYPQVANWLAGVCMNSLKIEKSRLNGPSEKNFTRQGKKEFISFVESNPRISDYINESSSMLGMIRHVPVLIYAGVSEGRFVWNYDVPMMLVSQNPDRPLLSLTAHVRVVRVNDGKYSKGLAIENWNLASERSY